MKIARLVILGQFAVPTFPLAAGALLLASATLMLSRWLLGLDVSPPAPLHGAQMQMKANAAFGFACLALGLVLLARRTAPALPIVFALAAVAGLTGALTGAEYLFDRNLGIDCLLAADPGAMGPPGRMAPLAALTLVLAGAALACANGGVRRFVIASQALAIAFGSAGMATLLGYLYGAPRMLFHAYEPMALSTAIVTLLLALAILGLHPHAGVAAPICSGTVAARMGRRMLLSVSITMPLFAWIRLRGEAMHLYSTEFGVSLVVTCSLLLMMALIVAHTAITNRAETRIHYLNRVYSVLSEVNALVAHVDDRAALFEEASRIAVERGGFPRAWFGVLDARGEAIELVAGINAAPDAALLQRLSLYPANGRPGPIARAFGCARPIVSNDVSRELDDPSHADMLAQGIRSYAVFPLILDGKVIGIFKLHAEVPNFFHAEELRLLNELVGDIVFAIRHLEQRRQLDYLAYFDALTGLAHPRLLEQRLNQAIAQSRRRGEGLALAVLDLAAFKQINDAFGRAVGDDALKQFARRLSEAAGEDQCARLGSNLFALTMPGLALETEAAAAYERIAEHCFGREFEAIGQRFALSAFGGIAMLHDDDAKTMLANAETALERARALGQRCRFHDDDGDARVAERIKLHYQLAQGLERAEFALHYQAKIDARSGEISGVEALLRWHNAELGSVSPARFIPVLEETGLIDKVGDWVLRQAAAASRHLRQSDPALRIAVNVSAAQLLRPDFVARVRAALGPDPTEAGIDLELTESLLMTDIDGAIDKLRQLRALGLRIALDDFGTGYSSMAYLARLPLDYLKIDRAFVTGLPDDPESRTIISSMISLGHALGLKIIAEGVETGDQAGLLTALGCDQLQGFYFARPEPRAALEERLRAHEHALV
ncbi:bifunctional diguanylate cyclase/phosphodiesterase [Massilia sp. 9096]|uniref:putative bifunctional diguanylate cyclase/phosphodiesterase n=1 Tax=Massilia sp. 9096 TaxID=1500894 RepID=UPI00068C2965|nr:EAL domain-containing protein [Massilia sp. 9096]